MSHLGPRQTGQEGCDKALAYIRESLEDIRRKLPDSAAKWTVEELPDPPSVTVALDRTAHPSAGDDANPAVRQAVRRSNQRQRRPAKAPSALEDHVELASFPETFVTSETKVHRHEFHVGTRVPET